MGLIVTRRPQERLFIGKDVIVTVLSVKGCQVRIDITAPKSVLVLREEVAIRLAQEEAAAVMRGELDNDPVAIPDAPWAAP